MSFHKVKPNCLVLELSHEIYIVLKKALTNPGDGCRTVKCSVQLFINYLSDNERAVYWMLLGGPQPGQLRPMGTYGTSEA